MGRWVSLCPCHNYLKEAALTSICRAKNKLFLKKDNWWVNFCCQMESIGLGGNSVGAFLLVRKEGREREPDPSTC